MWRAGFGHVPVLTARVAVALTPTIFKGQFRQKKPVPDGNTDLHKGLKSTLEKVMISGNIRVVII